MARPLTSRLPKGVRRVLKAVPGATKVRDLLYMHPKGNAPATGELRPVIYLPTWAEWDVMKQRPQYLMHAFAKAGHEVWFVDPRIDHDRVVEDGVRLVRSLRPAPPSDVILYTHFAPTRTLIPGFARPAVIYDLLDDLSIYDADEAGLPAHRRVRHHHDRLVDRADIMIASNPVLVERHLHEKDDLLLIENGVDLSLFKPGSARTESGRAPVVGYHGAIAEWLDFDLIVEIARRRPDLEFVFIGPVLPEARGEAARLAAQTNVRLLPPQTSDEVAISIRGFDVGFVPFVVNEMTEGVTPLKMFEYLASGIPVLATPLPSCQREAAVRTASSPESAAAEIDDLLRMPVQERASLRKRAEAASWDRRILPLLERLEEAGLRTV